MEWLFILFSIKLVFIVFELHIFQDNSTHFSYQSPCYSIKLNCNNFCSVSEATGTLLDNCLFTEDSNIYISACKKKYCVWKHKRCDKKRSALVFIVTAIRVNNRINAGMSLEFKTNEQTKYLSAWAIIDTKPAVATIVKLKCITNLQNRSSRKFGIEM